MKITKAMFIAYENVRLSGVTNMFVVKDVSVLSGLERAEIIEIMRNYDVLEQQYCSKEK